MRYILGNGQVHFAKADETFPLKKQKTKNKIKNYNSTIFLITILFIPNLK